VGFRSRCMVAAVLVSLTVAAPAWATFPGHSGNISFNRFFELGNEQFRGDLFTVNPDGSDVFQLTNFGVGTFSELSDHSPDGRTLAFQRFNFEPEGPSQIWLTDADGTDARQLTDLPEAFDPAFSPDGRTLAIDAVIDDVPGIFLIPARARPGKLIGVEQARRVTSVRDGGFDSEPQFSPNGRWIVFTRFSVECADDTIEDCRTRIYRVRTDGTGLRLLADTPLNASAPDWHPSGLMIAFDVHDNTFAPNVGHIVVMLADGSRKRVIVRGDRDSHYGNPSFSPDGRRVAFTHWPLGPDGNPDETLKSSIWTAWANGAKPRQVTRGAWDNKADWGPAVRRRHDRD
jgi:Tol biopolymer transport system component